MKKILIACLLFCAASTSLYAQNDNKYGNFSGSLESYSQYYREDSAIGAARPQDRFGSNNFLKLDYNFKNFTAGIQYEAYTPGILGFPGNYNSGKLINRYFTYRNQKFAVTVGDFYEQFGSGLVFRSWENRQIGINNAIEGVNVQISPADFFTLKVIYGRQRDFFERGKGIVRGADFTLDLTGINKKKVRKENAVNFRIGGSVVSRYESYTGPDLNFPATVNAVSGRAELTGNRFSLSAEYVTKNKDPHLVNVFDTTRGKALLVNATYTGNNFGANIAYRGMYNMDFRGQRDAELGRLLVNYIPALTRQSDYLLPNIYVYNPQAYGENGFQADLFYNFPKGTGLGGKYGTRIALNASRFTNLDQRGKVLSAGKAEYFHDYNVEIKKKFSSQWKMTLSYHNVLYNKSVIEGGVGDTITSNIVVVDATYKYSKNNSVRFELQHLSTKQDNKNWASALMELSFSPRWTAFILDMYNYGSEKKLHYYLVGGSYTRGPSRFILSYGRQRPGLLCVGGVCRLVPAASGLNATLFTTF